MYGEEIQPDCVTMPELLKSDCMVFYNAMKFEQKCTLEKYNIYNFEASVRMKSGIWGKPAEIKLLLNNYFKNFTFSLKPNDHVWFKGVLVNDDSLIGGPFPYVRIEEIGCLACHDLKLTQVKLTPQTKMIKMGEIVSYLYQGLKCVLNFLFNPVVVFK